MERMQKTGNTRKIGIRAKRLVEKIRATLSSNHKKNQKPIVTCLKKFSRALRQLHVFTSSFDWFTGMSVSFVIG